MTYLRTALVVVLASTFGCQSKDKSVEEKSRIAAKSKDGPVKNAKKKGKRKRGKARAGRKGPIRAIGPAKEIESGGKTRRKSIPTAIHFTAKDWEDASAGLATIASDFKDNDAWLEILPVPVNGNTHYLAVPRCGKSSPEVTCTPHVKPSTDNAWTFASCSCVGGVEEETAAGDDKSATAKSQGSKPDEDAAKGDPAVEQEGVTGLSRSPARILACQPTFADGKFSCTGDCGTDACSPALTADGRLGCPCAGATAAAGEPG